MFPLMHARDSRNDVICGRMPQAASITILESQDIRAFDSEENVLPYQFEPIILIILLSF